MAPKTGRLYAKAVFTGFKRGQRNQRENTALLKMEGCAGKEEARYCLFLQLPTGHFYILAYVQQ